MPIFLKKPGIDRFLHGQYGIVGKTAHIEALHIPHGLYEKDGEKVGKGKKYQGRRLAGPFQNVCQILGYVPFKPGDCDEAQVVKDAANVFAPAGYDIEIVEKHHNQKVDAPSGTAIALADSINEARGGEYEYVYDRSQVRKKRDKKELGISAVRGGTIVGEHEVIFAGIDEVIEFKHTAYSKSVFAKGAVEAAKFLAGKPAGMYDMADVIG